LTVLQLALCALKLSRRLGNVLTSLGRLRRLAGLSRLSFLSCLSLLA
jgi:hypothetical protein